MILVERIADGRRKFFPAPGEIRSVYLRDKKGHRDRALEPGRDYEVEVGGATLTKVPAAGERVLIEVGERRSSAKTLPKVFDLDAGGNQLPAPDPDIVSENPPTMSSWTDQVLRSAVEIGTQSDRLDLETVKSVVVLAVRDTAEAVPRTAEWQDELARLTAIVWTAGDLDAIRAGLSDIETYLGGAP